MIRKMVHPIVMCIGKYLNRKNSIMNENSKCPKCESEYTYETGNMMACTQCFYEWDSTVIAEEQAGDDKVVDANGNTLQNGDTVIVIKDLPVKGAPKPIKSGTKVKNIRLTDGDHNIDCKIDGFGAMALKSEFVRKA